MNRTKRSSISLVIMLALIIILGVSTAYAWFTASVSGSIDFTFSSGNINIQVTSNNAAINSQTFTKTGVMPGDALLSHDVVANKSEESVSFYFRMEISLDVDDALSGMFTASKIGLGTDFVQDTSVTDTAVFYYGTADALTEVSTTDEILLLDADNLIIPTTLTQLDEYAQAGKGITLTVVVVAIQSANMMNTMAAFKSVIAGDVASATVNYTISADGQYLYFGSYPQTLKESNVTVTTAPDANGYYLGSDGEKYAKLIANTYDNDEDQYTTENDTTLISGETYYFKVEPIKWRILSKTDNTYTVVSDMALNGVAYQPNIVESNGNYYATDAAGTVLTDNGYVTANNYKHSNLRSYLNDDFYNQAFSSVDRACIQLTTVNSSLDDYIYALSYDEANNLSEKYFFATDYAKGAGLFIDILSHVYSWTRTPTNDTNYVDTVGDGSVGSSYDVNYPLGLLPAMVVTLAPQSSGTVTEGEIFTENGKKYMYFGSYPQTLKASDVTVSATAGSDGYYTGSDGAKYAKQTVTNSMSQWGWSDDNWVDWAQNKASDGRVMTLGTDYYFKVEPIKWRVLTNSNGTYTIVCDSILSGLAYQPNYSGNYATDSEGNILEDSEGNQIYANNYEYSNLRTWLNSTFYNSAFTTSQKSSILTTTVDNSANQYPSDLEVDADNQYLCKNTSDKIYALSMADVTNTAYGFNADYSAQDTARYWGTTDYARASGAVTFTVEYFASEDITEGSDDWDTYAPYINSGAMWLRSPFPAYSNDACVVTYGHVGLDYVSRAYGGAVPALQISL